MHRSKRFELQGRSRERKFPLLLVVLTITTTIIASGRSSLAADEEGGCAPAIGRIVSLQGTIEALRAGAQSWIRIVRLDTPVCEGDRLRAARASRAAVFLQPENLIRLDQNSEILFSQSAEETFLEFFQEHTAVAPDAQTQGCGAGYVITRFPRKFRIRTPHVNAAVEGTEFLVALRCELTELAVFEGKVRAQAIAQLEERLLESGQVLAASAVEPPAIRLLVKPADAVQWALYYPPLSDAGLAVASADECRQLPAGAVRQICFAQRAEHFLRLGRVDHAEGEIDQALSEPQATGEALAVRAIIKVVQNDKEAALVSGQEAVAASPNSSRAWLALSYAQQASFKLEDATQSVQRAAQLSPDSSLVQSRLAEMFMSLGRTREAEKAARRAVAANPNEERAHTVLGFVHLAQINVKEAQADFLKAIERDSTAPLPRLGLGLAIIRQGQLVPGREQLEIAVALDPTNSLLRSYVGKAYYEENTRERDRLAATQLDLAKQLDPNDPTPWFYGAILDQTINRPIEAFRGLQISIDKNENRAVYRSKLFLDQDSAARSASLARTYNELGAGRLALSEAYKSLALDPGSYSAHRFLAEAYANQPRHEIARVSELLQAQLRQPLNSLPSEPELASDRLGAPRITAIRGIGPQLSGIFEYDRLFEGDDFSLRVDGVLGSRNTLLDQLIASLVQGNIALSLSEFGYQTDGFEANSDGKKRVYGGFLQAQLRPATSVQFEVRTADLRRGDTQFAFDPDLITFRRIDEDIENLRLGAYHRFGPSSELLLSLMQQRKSFVNPIVGLPPRLTVESDWWIGEAQYVWYSDVIRLVTGVSRFTGEDRTISASPFTREVTHDIRYAHAHVGDFGANLYLTLGISGEDLDSQNLWRDLTNPKLGLLWSPALGTTIRTAYFKTVKRQLIANQTLEPTQVAGFNQFFDDPTGTVARTRGVGFDQRLTRSFYVGAEGSKRDLDIPSVTRTGFDDLPWLEYVNRAYLYWFVPESLMPRPLRAWSASVTTDVLLEKFQRHPDLTGREGIVELRSVVIPISLSAHRVGGLSFRVTVSRAEQDGLIAAFPDTAQFAVDEEFWVTDADISYRMPRRLGILTLGVRNVFDRPVEFRETDPVMLRFTPERFIFGRLSMVF